MTDFNTSLTPLADLAGAKSEIADLTTSRDEARLNLNRVLAEVEALRSTYRNLRQNTQEGLSDWAENNLTAGEDSYTELSDLMVELGLEGLKRLYTVTVRVTYEFEVEVSATSEDDAQGEVENDIAQHISDQLDPGYYEDIDITASEA